jgi:hypothetical protein
MVTHQEVASGGVLILEMVCGMSWDNDARVFKKQLQTINS